MLFASREWLQSEWCKKELARHLVELSRMRGFVAMLKGAKLQPHRLMIVLLDPDTKVSRWQCSAPSLPASWGHANAPAPSL